MQLSLDPETRAYQIKCYSASTITILNNNNEIPCTNSLIIQPEALYQDWPIYIVEHLQVTHISDLAKYKPEIIIFGTGNKTRFLSSNILEPLFQSNIGYECMDTGTACRTYNLLASEYRNVLAALIIEG